jgi:sugar/nucleoside kinase (ribokinase family)
VQWINIFTASIFPVSTIFYKNNIFEISQPEPEMNNQESKVDVVVIGELNVDIILNGIDSLPQVGKEILADSMQVTLGSSSAIFASNLSALGVKVAFIGKIGHDNFARVVLDSLGDKGVDTDHIIISKSLKTGATIVLVYDQDRANITYPGAMYDLSLEDIDFKFLTTARHMHFATCFMQPGIKPDLHVLFRKSKEAGLTTSLDAQWDPEEKWDLPLEKLLPYVDIFLPNMQEFKFLTNCSSIQDGIRKIKDFSRLVIIKNGSDGAYAWDGNEIIHQPAFVNERVVDTVGAGDSFDAGFIREYINKGSLIKCLQTGALAGAVNTTAAGGTAAFRNIEMIRKIARERFNFSMQ